MKLEDHPSCVGAGPHDGVRILAPREGAAEPERCHEGVNRAVRPVAEALWRLPVTNVLLPCPDVVGAGAPHLRHSDPHFVLEDHFLSLHIVSVRKGSLFIVGILEPIIVAAQVLELFELGVWVFQRLVHYRPLCVTGHRNVQEMANGRDDVR